MYIYILLHVQLTICAENILLIFPGVSCTYTHTTSVHLTSVSQISSPPSLLLLPHHALSPAADTLQVRVALQHGEHRVPDTDCVELSSWMRTGHLALRRSRCRCRDTLGRLLPQFGFPPMQRTLDRLLLLVSRRVCTEPHEAAARAHLFVGEGVALRKGLKEFTP